eukprot:scaffold108315_cov30-Tisochrysis_lutea.AAC.4
MRENDGEQDTQTPFVMTGSMETKAESGVLLPRAPPTEMRDAPYMQDSSRSTHLVTHQRDNGVIGTDN